MTANPDDPTSLGIYTCEAVNCMGRVYSSSKVNLGKESDDNLLASADADALHAPPLVFTTELKNLKIRLGDSFTLGCQGKFTDVVVVDDYFLLFSFVTSVVTLVFPLYPISDHDI